MKLPSEEIYDYLNNQGFSHTMYIGADPYPDIDKYVVLRESVVESNPKWLRDEISIQVQGASQHDLYPDGMKMMFDAFEILNGAGPFTTTDSTNARFIVQNGPAYVGPDENKRHYFSMNIQYIREPDTGTNREPIG